MLISGCIAFSLCVCVRVYEKCVRAQAFVCITNSNTYKKSCCLMLRRRRVLQDKKKATTKKEQQQMKKTKNHHTNTYIRRARVSYTGQRFQPKSQQRKVGKIKAAYNSVNCFNAAQRYVESRIYFARVYIVVRTVLTFCESKIIFRVGFEGSFQTQTDRTESNYTQTAANKPNI